MMDSETSFQDQGLARGQRLEAAQVEVGGPVVTIAGERAAGLAQFEFVEPAPVRVAPDIARDVAQAQARLKELISAFGLERVARFIACYAEVGKAGGGAAPFSQIGTEPGAELEAGLAEVVEEVFAFNARDIEVEGEVVAGMAVDPNGNGGVGILNAKGPELASMGADPNGDGIVETRNSEGVWKSL